MNLKKYFCFVLLLWCAHAQAALSPGDALGLSPFWDWKTIETEHFQITFPKELEAQAQKSAQYFEQAHAALSTELIWSPLNRTHILLVDNSDAANGLTTPVSRFGILLYLTPPETWFSTSYYDDWLKLLVFHEYAHFLNMDASRDFYKVLRALFGDVILPNTFWPTWMLEGLAVYIETKYTKAGRGRSPYYEMIVRAAVEENRLDKPDLITLDQLHGPHPGHPGGEIYYLYGYQLFNEISKIRADAAGRLSETSSARIPYFNNSMLENVVQKDWYKTWSDWVEKAKTKAQSDLAAIKRAPLTAYERVPETTDESLGASISPDDHYLAWSESTPHQWQSLFMRDLKTQETHKIEDKFFGVGHSFLPDSSQLVYSSLRRNKNYYFLSDLKAYDIKSGSSYWLTKKLRAKDPHISQDGQWITFTAATRSSMSLFVGKLTKKSNGRLAISQIKMLVEAPMLDRISNPQWSPDQKSVVFSYKVNGAVGEEIRRYTFKDHNTDSKIETLVAGPHFNRFPAYHPSGALFFVSDQTGVDNLYRYDPKKSLQVTNVTTGLWLPSFSKNSTYASIYSADGWSIAKLNLQEGLVTDSIKTTISAPQAPIYSDAPTQNQTYTVKDYSVFSTLKPRQWAPLLLISENQSFVGAQAFGYDATFRHQYLGIAAYTIETKTPDFYANYINRTLGVTLSGYAALQTQSVLHLSNDVKSYTRKKEAGLSAYFPFQYTISTLTPEIGLNIERTDDHRLDSAGDRILSRSRYVPTQDFSLTYSSTRSSRFAIKAERGSKTVIGTRRYDDSERENFKLIAKHAQYFHLGSHFVLTPTLKATRVTKRNSRYSDANVILEGRNDRLFNPFPQDSFDEFGIRGYPNLLLATKEAASAALDLDFPLAQIFRGWGTYPLFFNQLSMNLFGEWNHLPKASRTFRDLTSAGGGIRLSTQWFYNIPLVLSADYHQGFKKDALGKGEAFFAINFGGALPFEF